MQVRFNDVDEFLVELDFEASNIAEGILRLTVWRLFQHQFVDWSVVGTALLRNGLILKLNHPIGRCFIEAAEDNRNLEKSARKVMEHIRAAAQAILLFVRGGVYE